MTVISNGEAGLSVREKLNKIWEDLELNAIDASIADTAVDVFVYRTSKDSDGGAWRKRTQHTSWYNETLNTSTRGSRKEFPAVAVVVAESSKVTIYDGDDPSLPMWMVFTSSGWAGASVSDVIGTTYLGSAVTSISASNGIIAVGVNNDYSGVRLIKFPSDGAEFYRQTTHGIFNLGLVDRNLNVNTTKWTLQAEGRIVDETVNDVAMTVLPDAPTDADTGLPVPTIAVATDGGVSVIKDDGTVVDSAYKGIEDAVTFSEDGLFISASGGSRLYFGAYSDLQNDNFETLVFDTDGTSGDAVSVVPFKNVVSTGNEVFGGSDVNAEKGVSGLSLNQYDASDFSKGMSALLTSTYNTGWMVGDIKGAFLSDTDDSALVGSGELVTNGTFDSDVSGWVIGAAPYTTLSFDAGTMEIIASGGTARVNQGPITVEVGKTYRLTVTCTEKVSDSHSFVHLGTSLGGTQYVNNITKDETAGEPSSFTFTATSTELYIQVGAVTATVNYDNISVKLADADRSVNNNGPIINGTVTRTAVATGADLVAYSGFSASNYLEQPYNSDLDFGTGDFCVMAWARDTNAGYIIDRSTSVGGERRYIYILSDGTLGTNLGPDGQGSGLADGSWHHICVARKDGVSSVYTDGFLAGAAAFTGNVVGTSSPVLRIGTRYNGLDKINALALLRISATAPSADQIAKIYDDEKILFQENAQATLYGASDAVTALAHDDVTDLLHVGTSAGRSDFQGLRRVSNTTSAVSTAISASNGLIVEQ